MSASQGSLDATQAPVPSALWTAWMFSEHCALLGTPPRPSLGVSVAGRRRTVVLDPASLEPEKKKMWNLESRRRDLICEQEGTRAAGQRLKFQCPIIVAERSLMVLF